MSMGAKMPSESKKEQKAYATALVSMPLATKCRLTATAKKHGLSLSAFLRLAADEYIKIHGW